MKVEDKELLAEFLDETRELLTELEPAIIELGKSCGPVDCWHATDCGVRECPRFNKRGLRAPCWVEYGNVGSGTGECPVADDCLTCTVFHQVNGDRESVNGVFRLFHTVKGVAVDVTAKTAAAARVKALAQGEREAFRRLIERLTLRSSAHLLPRIGDEELATYVKSFDVAQEKTSAVRYLATLNYRFQAEEVRRLLNDYGLPFAETPSKPVLVLPVYQAAGALMLWDDPNPWRDAWMARREVDGLVPLVMPRGDLSDIATIGVEQAVNGDAQRLSAAAARYEASGTLVALGVLGIGAGQGLPELEVFVTRYGATPEESTVVMSFAAVPGESIDVLLERSATEVAHRVQDDWKRDNLLEFGQSGVIAVTVSIGGLNDWLTVQQRLGSVAVIRHVDLVLLSRDEVRVNLNYIGNPGQLAMALQQADLSMSQDGDSWLLGLAGKPRWEKK